LTAAQLDAAMLRAAPRATVSTHEAVELCSGWQIAACQPGACADPSGIARLDWHEVTVPTTAGALRRAAGVGGAALDAARVDGRDWWFRRHLDAGEVSPDEELVLAFDGLATVVDVYVRGQHVLESQSMFEDCVVRLPELAGDDNELVICARALTPLLGVSRRPRARWRTAIVADGGLRFFRTMLMGRALGFASGPPVVGPWRPVRLERRRRLAVTRLELRPRLLAGAGVLHVVAGVRAVAGAALPERLVAELEGHGGAQRCELELAAVGDGLEGRGEVVVPDVELWWPHTHGEPSLYRLTIHADGEDGSIEVDGGRVGFRELAGGEAVDTDGLQLRVNGVPVFARGVVWTPLAATDVPCADAGELRAMLESLRAAGMNMVRIPGVAAYESSEFHDLCDELGILVWQDFMFARMDYPQSDPAFVELVRRECRRALEVVAGRPSLAVLCGSSEVDQQPAMMGLDVDPGAGPLFGELLPALIADAGVDAVWCPSTPFGGVFPFRPDRGISHYFGVGGYQRPLSDARECGVRFAAECLAFANMPDEDAVAEPSAAAPHGVSPAHPLWKSGVPRDAGGVWDGEDVRDHYLGSLFGVFPAELRRNDLERYVELSRAVTGELMAEVLGEWRRGGSPCGGALIHWLRDLRPGAGWGLLDHRGRPKAAYHHVRRALAPLAVWSTDEGLSGIAVHVANDGASPVRVRLRVSLFRDFETAVGEASRELTIEAHGGCSFDVEELLGRFVDVSWAYRFGPAPQDLVVFSLEEQGTGELLSQSFRLPAGRPLERESAARLGLAVELCETDGESSVLSIYAGRFAYGVRVDVPGYLSSDDAFSLEPGRERSLRLTRVSDVAAPVGTLAALNLYGRMPIKQ